MTSMPAPAAAAQAAAQQFVIEFTTISLVIQWVGILVVGGLLLFLTQSIRRRFLDDWAAAWCCLIVALGALYLDFRQEPPHHFLRAAYFLAEYGFGFLLVAGCRDFAVTAGVAGGTGASGAAGPRAARGTGSGCCRPARRWRSGSHGCRTTSTSASPSTRRSSPPSCSPPAGRCCGCAAGRAARA